MALIERQNKILVQPQGCLDLAGGAWLKQQLAMIPPRRYELWLIDLSSVEFIDSAGLVALAGALKTASQMGASLVLLGLRPSARLIFEITQLDRIFTIFENYDSFLLSQEFSMVLETA